MILAGEGEEAFPKLLRVLFEEAGEGSKFQQETEANAISDFERALGLYGIDGLAFRKEDAVIVNSSSKQLILKRSHSLTCIFPVMRTRSYIMSLRGAARFGAVTAFLHWRKMFARYRSTESNRISATFCIRGSGR